MFVNFSNYTMFFYVCQYKNEKSVENVKAYILFFYFYIEIYVNLWYNNRVILREKV